jgi:hypothetical protein
MISETLVLVGCHGAGKSTLGHRLAVRLGYDFHDEIGLRLASDPARRPPDRTAADAQYTFDRAVFDAELQRDFASVGVSRVVETWHPGNLAYAALRSPAVVVEYLTRLQVWPRGGRVRAIVVEASDAVLAARQWEPGPLAFFQRVGRDAEAWCRELGIPIAARVRTDAGSPDQLTEHLIKQLQRDACASLVPVTEVHP